MNLQDRTPPIINSQEALMSQWKSEHRLSLLSWRTNCSVLTLYVPQNFWSTCFPQIGLTQCHESWVSLFAHWRKYDKNQNFIKVPPTVSEIHIIKSALWLELEREQYIGLTYTMKTWVQSLFLHMDLWGPPEVIPELRDRINYGQSRSENNMRLKK